MSNTPGPLPKVLRVWWQWNSLSACACQWEWWSGGHYKTVTLNDE